MNAGPSSSDSEARPAPHLTLISLSLVAATRVEARESTASTLDRDNAAAPGHRYPVPTLQPIYITNQTAAIDQDMATKARVDSRASIVLRSIQKPPDWRATRATRATRQAHSPAKHACTRRKESTSGFSISVHPCRAHKAKARLPNRGALDE